MLGAVWLTLFVTFSLVFFGHVSAGGVYCAQKARGMLFKEQPE